MNALYFACLTALSATAAWTITLLFASGERSDTSVALIGLSWWALGGVAVVGMLVVRGRWARRLSLAVVGSQGVVALLLPTGRLWAVSLGLSGIAAIALGGPFIDPHVRQRAAATGIPVRAIVVPLLLGSTPLAVGLTGEEGWPLLAGGVTALIVAAWFLRVVPAALLMVRVVWPLLTFALAFVSGGWGGLALVVAGTAVAVAAWHPTVATAVHPLTKRGSVVPIPPELTPGEVLDAADLDDRERRK